MRLILIPVCLFMLSFSGYAQNDVLFANDDMLYIKFSNSPNKRGFRISEHKDDTIDMGTDGAIGLKATIYYGNDSLVVPYTKMPHKEDLYFPVRSLRGRAVYYLHFNPVRAAFSPSYVAEHDGRVFIEVPEVYELANIIWTLSPSGQRAVNLNKQGKYFERVMDHFKPFLDHPVFKKLDVSDGEYFNKYFDFRENSLCYDFKDGKLVSEGPYYMVWGSPGKKNLFQELVPLMEDFASKSDFRKFYAGNKSFYNELVNRQQQLMPVEKMWKWMEKEFPNSKFNSYKIVFSPLINSSHSTQQFYSFNHGWYAETVMFVCGPEIYDTNIYTEVQKEGLLSGVVFTEIDHNYVNPATAKYSRQVDSIFSKPIWVKKPDPNAFYSSAVSIFNEYMTHALFSLYVLENYDEATAKFLIERREWLMVERREFVKFKEFNKALLDIRKENPGVPVVQLFEKIIAWAKTQH